MATDEMPTERLCPPPGGLPPPGDVGDDEELLLYLYEKSSETRAKCFDCVSMGRMTQEGSGETAPDVDRELLSRSTEHICSKTLTLAGPNTPAIASVPGVVRSCRSQENYYDLSDMICVDIDIDENLASSVDALHYRESVVSRTSDLSRSLETVELENGDQGVPVTTPDDIGTPDEMAEGSSAEDLSPSSCHQEETLTPIIHEPLLVEENQTSSSSSTSPDVDEPDGGSEDQKPNEDTPASFDDEGKFVVINVYKRFIYIFL